MHQKKVLGVGAGRYSDRKYLATYVNDSTFAEASDRCKNYFLNLMNQNRADFGVPGSVVWDVYLICYVIREEVDMFCYSVCISSYPLRLAVRMMDEFYPAFQRRYGPKIKSAKDNELSKSAKDMLSTLSNK